MLCERATTSAALRKICERLSSCGFGPDPEVHVQILFPVETAVTLVDDENVAHSRAIKVAAEVPQLYAVESGLTEKDRVLVDGLRKVRDGQEIDPDVQPPAEVFGKLEVAAE